MPKFIINEHGRECSGCRVFLPWSSFGKNSSAPYGYRAKCRACLAEVLKKKVKENAIKKQEHKEEEKPQIYNVRRAFLIERIHLKRAA